MKNYVIIVAGGSGSRMKSELPKQFLEVAGVPVLMRTIQRFYTFDASFEIILVLPAAHFDLWNELCGKHSFVIAHKLVEGGDTRFQSVKNGLKHVKGEGLIAVHDGVRPFVSHSTIERCFKAASIKGNAIPVIEIAESVRTFIDNFSRPIDRSNLRIVQTPQVFKSKLLLDAYFQDYHPEFTDDASVVEKLGFNIYLVKGNQENIKITTPYDMIVAEGIATREASPA